MVKKGADTRLKQPPKVKSYKPNEFWDLLEKMLSSQYDNEEVAIIMQQYRTVSCFFTVIFFLILISFFARPTYPWWNNIDLISFFFLTFLTKTRRILCGSMMLLFMVNDRLNAQGYAQSWRKMSCERPYPNKLPSPLKCQIKNRYYFEQKVKKDCFDQFGWNWFLWKIYPWK